MKYEITTKELMRTSVVLRQLEFGKNGFLTLIDRSTGDLILQPYIVDPLDDRLRRVKEDPDSFKDEEVKLPLPYVRIPTGATLEVLESLLAGEIAQKKNVIVKPLKP